MELNYWMVLIFWILIVKNLKHDSGVTLKYALVLFVVSATFTVFDIRNIAEPIMRVSFIGWVIGIIQALIEYIKENK